MQQFPGSTLPVSTLPAEVKDGVISFLEIHLNCSIIPGDFKIIAGGCINHGGVLQTSAGDFFVKWNDASHFPDLFETERKGLSLLENSKTVTLPKVIGIDRTPAYQFLVLEFVATGPPSESFWVDLGHQLATMHQCSAKTFGLDHDNYIGSLKQFNKPSASWIKFFVEERIGRQLMMAEKAGLTDSTLRKKFDDLIVKLPSLLPEGIPALLHGDLWGGNVISDETGNPLLIDPAVYFGNSEMEIAYTRLFGAFDPKFYAGYYEINRLVPGFEERVDLYNLYPLLIHTNLFGKTYLRRIGEILARFT